MYFRGVAAILGPILGIVVATAACAADQVTVKVGYSPGGGYDRYARLVAAHIGRFLPGTPSTAVENVPGAGSLRLTKMMMGQAPTDGSEIMLVNASVATTPLLNPDKAAFETQNLRWIGAMANQPSFCFVGAGSEIQSTEDFLSKPLKLGATGRTSATYIYASLVKTLFNPEIEVIVGFSGGNEVNLAIERGELDGRCGNSLTSLLSNGMFETANLMGQWTTSVPAIAAATPSLLDRVTDEDDAKAVRLVIGTLRVDYPFFLPAGTPDDVLDTYRAAFDAMVADPAFLADAQERGLLVDPTSGAEIAPYIAALTDVSPATIARARALIQ